MSRESIQQADEETCAIGDCMFPTLKVRATIAALGLGIAFFSAMNNRNHFAWISLAGVGALAVDTNKEYRRICNELDNSE